MNRKGNTDGNTPHGRASAGVRNQLRSVMPNEREITRAIAAARDGESGAKDRLYELIYDDLKRIALRIPHVGRPGDTMQPTVLLNEAYLDLERRFPGKPQEVKENRATFYNSVALAMRTLLRDYWRSKLALKRGGDKRRADHDLDRIALDSPSEWSGERYLALDEALERLEKYNPRWYGVVMHRYFAGQTIEQTAELMGAAPSTVSADWKLARAWLRQALGTENAL